MIEFMRRLVRRRRDRALSQGSTPDERAEYLLRSHLTSEQLADYLKTRTFIAVGQLTKLRYRVFPLVHHNIAVEDRHILCVVARSEMPLADHMLTHKLYIENAEERFLATLHTTPMQFRGVDWTIDWTTMPLRPVDYFMHRYDR